MTAKRSDPLLKPKEVAAILRVSVSTLKRWRRQGNGPAFEVIGNSVRYDETVIAAYRAERRQTSTRG